jgi:hypothetical protein
VNDLRAAKLIASSVMAGSGCISLALSEQRGGLGAVFGLGLLLSGIVFLLRNWWPRRGEISAPRKSAEEDAFREGPPPST